MGRKASLLAGGDGHAVQRVEVPVPPNRLHLVTVNAKGVARLTLSPRFEVDPSERVRRVDAPPSYDAPPSIEELFKEHHLSQQKLAEFLGHTRTEVFSGMGMGILVALIIHGIFG